MKYDNQIILAAHRGDKKRYPENTIPAFESALKYGTDMIETDVHMTSDGALVLIHDRALKRTTGAEGTTDQKRCKIFALSMPVPGFHTTS
jgi:glycerophosphoryl diester phosphodiesterase